MGAGGKCEEGEEVEMGVGVGSSGGRVGVSVVSADCPGVVSPGGCDGSCTSVIGRGFLAKSSGGSSAREAFARGVALRWLEVPCGGEITMTTVSSE